MIRNQEYRAFFGDVLAPGNLEAGADPNDQPDYNLHYPPEDPPPDGQLWQTRQFRAVNLTPGVGLVHTHLVHKYPGIPGARARRSLS